MAPKAQINIYTALKDAGFKKAEKGLKNLRFQANGLNRTLAKLGTGVAVTAFARQSVDAALKMETANAKLSVALTSVGKASALNGLSIKKTAEQMSDLGFKGTATAEALANLVTITGSLEKAQSLMGASADAARYLNVGLAEGAAKLGNAFGGSSKALQVFNIKLDKTLKPAEAFDKAMAQLNAKIGGQATAFATTYAGKLQILAAKFEEVQVQVGQKLLPYLVKLGDYLVTTGIPRLESFFTLMSTHKESVMGMAGALTTVALAFKSIATYATLAKVAALPIMGAAAPFVAAIAAVVGLGFAAQPKLRENQKVLEKANLGYDGVTGQYRDRSTGKNISQAEADKRFDFAARGGFKGSPIPGMNKGKTGFDRQGVQAAKDAAAAAKAAAALAKKEAAAKLAALRLINADKRLAAQFDLNQIALANALKLNLTEKEKAAVQGLIALQDDGYKTEGQRMAEQEASLKNLIRLRTDLASIPFYSPTLAGQEKQMPTGTAGVVQDLLNGNMDATSTGQLAKQLKLDAMTPAPAKNGGHAIAPLFNLDPSGIMTAQESALYNASRPAAAPQVTINVAGSILQERELIAMIQNGTQLASLSGSPSQIGRISGMFG